MAQPAARLGRAALPGRCRGLLHSRRRHSSSSAAAAAEDTAAPPPPSFARGLFEGRLFADLVSPWPQPLAPPSAPAEPPAEYERARSLVGGIAAALQKAPRAPAATATRALFDPPPSSNGGGAAALRDLGAYGSLVPQEYGGLELGCSAHCAVADALGEQDLSLARRLSAHHLAVSAVLEGGDAELRKAALPGMVRAPAAWCLAESGAGSDVTAVAARAESAGEGYSVSGRKQPVTGGRDAERFVVFAKTPQADGTERLAAFLVGKGSGVSAGAVPAGGPWARAGACEVVFEGAKVGADGVLGGPAGGFRLQDRVLTKSRCWEVAALTGAQRRALGLTSERVNTREQFRRKLRDFALVKRMVALMSLRLYASEAVSHVLASSQDAGQEDLLIDAACAKLFVADAAERSAASALQLAAADPTSSQALEQLASDIRTFKVADGTLEILRLRAAQSGLETAGKKLKDKGALRLTVERSSRTINRALGGVTVDRLPGTHPSLRKAAATFEQAVGELGGVLESVLIKFATKLKDEQLLCARVAGAVTLLYSMAAVLSRCSRSLSAGLESGAHESVMANAWVRHCHQELSGLYRELREVYTTNDSNLARISDHVFEAGGYIPSHPLCLRA
eukprot:TRINITY_DN55110_c0_g1_i1.p1 TRINITY_DN55110_c0_g1~~TRINITY_DN55110_c0_g1_i1.p1  ORF type:complete len:647 (+),score=167.14 TRINITY_DN55110_c0_g1_i1:70-1941(+)